MDVSSTAQAVSLPNIPAAIGWLNNPLLGIAGALAGAHFKDALAEVKSWVASIGKFLASPKAAAEVKDVTVLAADLQQALADAGHPEPAKASSIISGLLAQVPAIAKAAAQVAPMIFLAAFLGLGAGLHAEVAASTSGLFGSSTWSASDGGTFKATGSTIAGGEVNFAFGSLSGTAFAPLACLSLGAGWEDYQGAQYADLIGGLGVAIPDSPAMLIVGPDWRMFSGARYPTIMLGTSFQFGQPFWMGK